MSNSLRPDPESLLKVMLEIPITVEKRWMTDISATRELFEGEEIIIVEYIATSENILDRLLKVEKCNASDGIIKAGFIKKKVVQQVARATQIDTSNERAYGQIGSSKTDHKCSLKH